MLFVGENLDPEQILALLPLQPARSKKKGEPLGSRPGYPVPFARQGVLSFSAQNVDGNDINDHLRYFLKAILPVAAELKSVVNRDCLLWEIVCFFDQPPSNLRSMLDQSVASELDRLGIQLVVDDPATVEFVEEA
jgi:hypothetical protein